MVELCIFWGFPKSHSLFVFFAVLFVPLVFGFLSRLPPPPHPWVSPAFFAFLCPPSFPDPRLALFSGRCSFCGWCVLHISGFFSGWGGLGVNGLVFFCFPSTGRTRIGSFIGALFGVGWGLVFLVLGFFFFCRGLVVFFFFGGRFFLSPPFSWFFFKGFFSFFRGGVFCCAGLISFGSASFFVFFFLLI